MFRLDSIRTQILCLALGTTIAVVVLTVAYSGRQSWQSIRQSRIEQAETAATLLAQNLIVAVSFGDPDAAELLLQSLSTQPDVLGAVIVDDIGNDFATYGILADDPSQYDFSACSTGPECFYFDDQQLVVVMPLEEMESRIGTLITITETSDIISSFLNTLFKLSIAIAIGLLLATLAATRILNSIIRPVTELTDVARRVSAERDYSLRVSTSSGNELGLLCRQFNEMLNEIQVAHQSVVDAQKMLSIINSSLEDRVKGRTKELEQANQKLVSEVAEKEKAFAEMAELQSELVQSSRAAGMAEIASGVLHNIGNVLNSVKVATSVAKDKVDRLPISSLSRTSNLLCKKQETLGSEWIHFEGLEHLPGLLDKMSTALQASQAATIGELKEVEESVEFIAEIVRSQQSYARQPGIHETTEPAELLDSAVKMSSASTRFGDCRVVKDYQFEGTVTLDRSRVLQILCNFVKNGFEAMLDDAATGDTLTVSIHAAGDDRVQFSVTDQGVGISPENKEKLFSFGFTTKTNGHGFGLHSAACSAKEMGGSVEVHSDGVGCGATFVLELPITPPSKRKVIDQSTKVPPSSTEDLHPTAAG